MKKLLFLILLGFSALTYASVSEQRLLVLKQKSLVEDKKNKKSKFIAAVLYKTRQLVAASASLICCIPAVFIFPSAFVLTRIVPDKFYKSHAVLSDCALLSIFLPAAVHGGIMGYNWYL